MAVIDGVLISSQGNGSNVEVNTTVCVTIVVEYSGHFLVEGILFTTALSLLEISGVSTHVAVELVGVGVLFSDWA